MVWEWHAGRDMEVEKYPISPSQYRDEFAHANAIAPLPDGDILISFRRLNTIGRIDRQTRQMKWQHRDDSWGMQHDCAPLVNGNITVFANGCNVPTNPFSRVIELDPRTRRIVWEYRGRPSYTFFSPHISGAQRLASGNTLICEGQWGRLFEVTHDGDIVWEYVLWVPRKSATERNPPKGDSSWHRAVSRAGACRSVTGRPLRARSVFWISVLGLMLR